MKRKMTRFARGLSMGGWTASGPEAAWSRLLRAMEPNPALVRQSQSRRDNLLRRELRIMAVFRT
jgi:hypothetical protein